MELVMKRIGWLYLEASLVRGLGISLRLDGEMRRASMGLYLGVVSVWAGVPLPRWLTRRLPWSWRRPGPWRGLSRLVQLYFAYGALHWAFWGDDLELRHDDPWWMRGCWRGGR